MQLTLEIRSVRDIPQTDKQNCTFDQFPIVVGRAGTCDYVLADESRYISSRHAVITLENNKFLIKDTSSNGIYKNGDIEPIGPEAAQELSHNDTLAIGDFTIQVSIESCNRLAETKINASEPIPYDKPIDPFRGNEPDWSIDSSAQDNLRDDDFERIDNFNSDRSPNGSTADSDWADWASEIGSKQGTEPKTEPSPHFPEASDIPTSHDPFGWLSEDDDADASIANSGLNENSTGQTDKYSSPSTNPAYATSPGGGSTREALNALDSLAKSTPEASIGKVSTLENSFDSLLRGAALDKADFEGLDREEVLELTGHMLLKMTDVIMLLLESRSELKNAIHSDVTMLARKENNPLKFSQNAGEALTKLLSGKDFGYMQSDQALQEAVQDLKSHQLSMLAGMKSAVKQLIVQFDPEILKNNLEKNGGISANLPITREAKLWGMFCDQYDTISEEAVSDFDNLFRAEFKKAYEYNVKKTGQSSGF